MSTRHAHAHARPPSGAIRASPLWRFHDLEDAEAAYQRVLPDALALGEDQFTAFNVDVVAATATILGVLPRLLPYRERMAALPGFDLRHVDELGDRAKAAWYVAVTKLPEAEPEDLQALLAECESLRGLLLAWAGPLVHVGKFDRAAIEQFQTSPGPKRLASDVVALVALFRSRWRELRGACGLTEEQLERGAVLGPAAFAAVSRRENKTLPSLTEGAQKVRRFWTLADRSYDQCQRAIAFYEWGVGDLGGIAPSLRRNGGARAKPPAAAAPAAAETVATPAAAVGAQLGESAGAGVEGTPPTNGAHS